eukprot:CAMPEP_0117871158 /NCGR_PEP_ID=MMETSP0950-20121206/10333_1 /TAXON_ID=44440 /ORGANISM="Chattonella subsalsa, Strain CCMP2191" /LENGTH=862 /DNA_ID=CAMNT_0005723711 /DNA_START=12 /DNA_END=2601 /DNA_ORIENTATION=+
MTGPVEFQDRKVTPAAVADTPALTAGNFPNRQPSYHYRFNLTSGDRGEIQKYWQDILPEIEYLGADQKELVRQSLEVDIFRTTDKSGEPYIIHPVEVCKLLAGLQMDTATLQAGLLHDTVEDTELTFAQIEELFGTTVKRIVEGETKVSKLPKLSLQGVDEQAENLRQMFLAMTEDYRIILVKLADRLHNMRTIQYMPIHKQHKIARETLDIFAPLAHRLGIWNFKTELEEHSFRALYKSEERDLRAKIQSRDVQYDESLHYCKEAMIEQFEDDPFFRLQNVTVTIQGRQKELYSLWVKLKDPKYRGQLDNIKDTVALRVIIHYERQEGEKEEMYQNRGMYLCYHVLALVQNLRGCVPALGQNQNPVKDYIAVPKPNGYRSLHTCIRHKGQVVEVQIRTEEMHQQAEYGMAAHWLYKTGDVKEKSSESTRQWMDLIKDWNKEIKSSREFIDTIRREILGKRVLVFDQDGKILNLVRGATVVDAAFHIHSEIGLQMAGATINGNKVDLSYELRNGDVVIINTEPHCRPTPEWLRYAKHRSTRNKLRQYFRNQRRGLLIQKGQEILDDFMRQYKDIIQERKGNVPDWFELSRLVKNRAKKFEGIDDLCFHLALATSEIDIRKSMSKVLNIPWDEFTPFEHSPKDYWHGQEKGSEPPVLEPSDFSKYTGSQANKEKSISSSFLHELEEISAWKKNEALKSAPYSTKLPEELLVFDEKRKMRSLCSYCKPVWGDEILGTRDEKGETTLHMSTCPIVVSDTEAASEHGDESAPDMEIVPVKWTDADRNRIYTVDLEVKARDRRFLLSDASIVVSAKAFITDTWSKTIGIVAILRYSVELSDLDHLNELIESVLSIDGVISCQRLMGR